LSDRQPAVGVKPAGQFDLHVALSLAWTQRQTGQGLLVKFESDTDKFNIALQNCEIKTALPMARNPVQIDLNKLRREIRKLPNEYVSRRWFHTIIIMAAIKCLLLYAG
jgi:hypothetical protein